MKETVNVIDYAHRIQEALPRGILLNTQGEKFNSMVIGWGHLGVIWGKTTFVAYVREGRYTKPQLDKTGEFTVSIPLGDPDPRINRVCGAQSGRNVDKEKEAGLTLEPPAVLSVPGVREYPLTLECKVLYAQQQDLTAIPQEIFQRFYPQNVPSDNPLSNRDPHTAYIGEIVAAYIIR